MCSFFVVAKIRVLLVPQRKHFVYLLLWQTFFCAYREGKEKEKRGDTREFEPILVDLKALYI